ncbi:MAG TPA: hypothetical protein VKB93_19710 [Thermoanaerobaculia bacterium]|nr:hypothetical protein [Thermoanaerobaculia bacterium]
MGNFALMSGRGAMVPLAADGPDVPTPAGSIRHGEVGVDEVLQIHLYQRIDKIIAAQMSKAGVAEQEREDIRSDILLKIVARWSAVSSEGPGVIQSIAAYGAVIAFNACNDFMRRLHPLRAKMKARLRYRLSHDSRFAVWESRSRYVAGFRSWSGEESGTMPAPAESSIQTCNDMAATLFQLFEAAGHPLLVDDIVGLFCDIAGVPRIENNSPLDEMAPNPADDITERLQCRQYLQQVWCEVRALPLQQRLALLLHARDSRGESVTKLVPMTLSVSFDELADTLGMSADVLKEIWEQLPLDDLSIGSRLGLRRQQVINLRRSARDRITRRTRDLQ